MNRRGKTRTFGLTHIALAVRDVSRTLQFYNRLFGTELMYRGSNWAQVSTPGTKDILVFEEKPRLAGKNGGGILHFGFRLRHPAGIEDIRKQLKELNAPIVKEGVFESGEPFVFFRDPDGYEVEVWYERNTEEV